MEVPIPTLHLFPLLDEKLLQLLRGLPSGAWHAPTRAREWTVKDIASHLLDGNIRTISMVRDRFFGEKPAAINSYADLVGFLNQLNADWVKATKRLSPALLIELLASTGQEFHKTLANLNPFDPAPFSVAWAGEDISLNWFHIAREYTEKWHHQQQIREAVNLPGITSHELYHPVLSTFMRAFPHHYRDVTPSSGTVIRVHITGEAGGDWYYQYNGQWHSTAAVAATTQITLSDDTAWKLFTKGLPLVEAQKHIIIEGDVALGQPMYAMLAVMA